MSRAEIGQLTQWSGSPPSPIVSSSTTPVFARLPVEINIAIISLFCKHCNLQDLNTDYPSSFWNSKALNSALATLSALSKTCKLLQRQAQPILHHFFPGPSFCFQEPTDRHRFYLFLRTLSSRPDLASAVRCLGFDGNKWDFPRCAPWDERGSKQIVRAALHCGLSLPPAWFLNPSDATPSPYNKKKQSDQSDHEVKPSIDVRSFETHTFLILLALHLCQNAKVIDLCGLENDGVDHIPFNPTSISRIFFKNLQTFRVDNQPASVGFGCVRVHGDVVSGLFGHQPSLDLRRLAGLSECLPRVHTLHICLAFLPAWSQNLADSDSEPALHHDPAGLPRGLDLSLLTCLDLILCIMTEKHLGLILSGCVNLNDFTFVSMQFHTALSHPDRHVNQAAQAHEISSTLNLRCPGLHRTLRRLALEHLANDKVGYSGVYTSLKNFVGLEEICLGTNGLLTTLDDCHGLDSKRDGNRPEHPVPLADILPPNIVSLAIIEVGEWKGRVSSAIIDLLQEMKSNPTILRRLKEIRVWENPIWNWLDNDPRRDDFCNMIVTGEVWDPKLEELARTVGVRFCIDPRPIPPVIHRLQRSDHSLE